MHTLQVAPLSNVPNDYRLLVHRKLQEVRGQLCRMTLVAQGIRSLYGPAVQLRNSNHGYLKKLFPAEDAERAENVINSKYFLNL
jgi:hypothetical protein